MQAVAAEGGPIEVSVYRHDPSGCLEWMEKMVKKERFSSYLLRSAQDQWDVFDNKGAFREKCTNVVYDEPEDVMRELDVDLDRLDAQARSLLGRGLTRIVCAESHARVSSAEMSNCAVMVRRWVMEMSPEDVKHVFIVESHEYDCRIIAMYANVARMSRKAQDELLDRWKWLTSARPLEPRHARGILAEQLAGCRSEYLAEVISETLDPVNAHDLIPGTRMALFVLSAERRKALASEIVDIVGYGNVLRGARREGDMFCPTVLKDVSKKIARRYADYTEIPS